MKTIFGTVNESVQLVSRENMDNGFTKTVFKFGKLTVTGLSNHPSQEAIIRLADAMNDIAKKYVFGELKEDIA
jgi:hypothetical protein